MARAAADDGTGALDVAARLLEAGRIGEARTLAERAMANKPRSAHARRILGLCLEAAGDVAGAEKYYEAGLKLERGHPMLAASLADLLERSGRHSKAERVLRAALEANRRDAALMARLARHLTATGKALEAVRLTARGVAQTQPDHAVLAEHAAALKATGQIRHALAVHERAVALFPEDAVAHHNLAADYGDLGQFAAAERSAYRALAKGSRAPETMLVHGRALLGQNRLGEAERAFRDAVKLNPGYVDAHRDLAQLIWMRTEDAGAAIGVLDEAIGAYPQLYPLFFIRANVLRHAGTPEAALKALQQGVRLHPEQPGLLIAAAETAAQCGEALAGLAYAEQAAGLLPGDYGVQTALCAACLAVGDAERAGGLAEALVRQRSQDQRALAYQATAWRLLGDARYAALYNYGALVKAWELDVPPGWSTLDEYLADLTQALGGLHPFRTHPLDQSLRHGSQAARLLASENRVVQAFLKAVDGPIRRHLAEIGSGDDPFRSRNAGRYGFQGMWSVRLRPGGFHTDHVHPEGWVSSACYIALPRMESESREAWIKFGEPGIPTVPALGPEHFVQPEAGMLVLFPSYMWHGTVPFTGGGARLSVAFDLVPGEQK